MNPRHRLIFISLIIVISILACNLPAQTPAPPAPPELPATTPAQGNQPAPQNTPAITDTPPLPSETPTITPTATLSVPMVSVSMDTNCRSGPGKEYDLWGALLVGEKAEVVGKNTALNYWVIKNPDSAGTCWLWGQYATVEGNTSAIPEVPAPPTPTPSVPTAPGNFSVDRVCKTMLFPSPHLDMTNATLNWNDKSDIEEGFYIYRDGALIATLGPNTESYAENPPGLSHTYGVSAFGPGGESNVKEASVSCP